jgi:hypothetical protein
MRTAPKGASDTSSMEGQFMPREDTGTSDPGINPTDPDVQPDDTVVFQQDIALTSGSTE